MLAELLVGQDLDRAAVDRAVPPVGFHRNAPALLPGGGRLLKTHEPFRPQYRRGIYFVRDVRDVALSYYALEQANGRKQLDFAEFSREFARNGAAGYGTWQDNVASWVGGRDAESEILVLRYEDILADPIACLGEMTSFLRVVHPRSALQRVVERSEASMSLARLPSGGIWTPSRLGRRFDEPEGPRRPAEHRKELDALAACSPMLMRLGYDSSR